MEFRQIQTFMQIAQVKNFSKTAELLGYSQSAVTVQIRQKQNWECGYLTVQEKK